MNSIIERLASITVTYNPSIVDGRLACQLLTLSKICKICVLIDNGSNNIVDIRTLTKMYPIVKIIELRKNEGIATALNLAVDYFRNIEGIEWIITMDQDSFIPDSVIQNIPLETVEYISDRTVAAFGLNYEDFHFRKRKLVNNLQKPLYVDFLITSGCIVRKEVIEKYKFDANLFMYNVDTDFCKRLRRDHLKLILLSTSFMFHKGGEIDMDDNNEEYHYNEPEKFYFFGRNYIIMLKRYLDLKGLVYLILLLMENIIANRDIPQTFSNLKRGLADGLHYILSK